MISFVVLTLLSLNVRAAHATDSCQVRLDPALKARACAFVREQIAGEAFDGALSTTVLGSRKTVRGHACAVGVGGGSDAAQGVRYLLIDANGVISEISDLGFDPEGAALRQRLVHLRRGKPIHVERVPTSRGWRVTISVVDQKETSPEKKESFAEAYEVVVGPDLNLSAKMVEIIFPDGHPASRPPPKRWTARWKQALFGRP
jgi:hypothetical protein